MAKEIIVKIPHGILGLDLKTNRVDFPGTDQITDGELVAREMEAEVILESLVAHQLITEDELMKANIYFMGTKEIVEGVVVTVNGRSYQLFADVVSENLN